MATFRLQKFTDPDYLNSISPQWLAAFVNPWRGYLAQRGLIIPAVASAGVDCEALAGILMTPDQEMPHDLVEGLYLVHETASEEDMDALLDKAVARGIDIERDPRTTVADVAIQMWLASPETLQEHHAEAVALRQKSFEYFGGTRDGGEHFPAVDEALRRNIEAALDDWFEQHRRGRGCRVFFFRHGPKVWILVRHGLPMRREASHQEDGGTATEFFRPQQHDVLIYDESLDEIGVHANTRGETRLYLTCLGRLLFGDDGYFPAADKFSLDPLIEDQANSLLCEDVEGLEAIRLVEYRRYWGGAFQRIEVERASDIFGALAERRQELGSQGRLVSATFRAKFPGSSKERSFTIRPPGIARYERDADGEVIERLLVKRGFILNPELEGANVDTDEAPSAILEVV